MEIISHNSKIDFLGMRHYAFALSAVLVGYSLYLWFSLGDAKYGIDFMGGSAFTVAVHEPTDAEKITKALEEQKLSGISVQAFEPGSNDYSIRIPLLAEVDAKVVKQRVEAAFGAIHPGKFEILKSDSVGASISEEVRQNALIAVAIGLVAILLYVTIRFEFSFALGALVALFHDVIIATGVFLFVGHALNGAALAAALTIVGYSVNDTIVIFDRVREEIMKRKDFDLKDLLNDSMNYCLSRTIITSLLTFFSVLSLLLFGGGAIQDLSVFLFAGILSGVYSTVYIAAPVVLWWENLRAARAQAKAAA